MGQVIAWRHGAWRVIESGRVSQVDWTEEDRQQLARLKPEYVSRSIPWRIVARPVRITADQPIPVTTMFTCPACPQLLRL